MDWKDTIIKTLGRLNPRFLAFAEKRTQIPASGQPTN